MLFCWLQCKDRVVIKTKNAWTAPLRGYCSLDQFCDCLYIFLKNNNTLVTSKNMFLIGNTLMNQITALEFYQLKWLLIYESQYEKYWFPHIFNYNLTTMVSTEIKLWLLSSFEHFLSDPMETLSKVAFLGRGGEYSESSKIMSRFAARNIFSVLQSRIALPTYALHAGVTLQGVRIFFFIFTLLRVVKHDL